MKKNVYIFFIIYTIFFSISLSKRVLYLALKEIPQEIIYEDKNITISKSLNNEYYFKTWESLSYNKEKIKSIKFKNVKKYIIKNNEILIIEKNGKVHTLKFKNKEVN